ncbi:hypothetical protein N7539_008056 [Penicillium diatomitis]|uniref:Vacuolar protein sorting-associated protein 62 n=1 Tax=Penicillium diatomitis TaxID=2819901 RepID=A0A9W9WT13_9EURO|nr:uncharacterized protein N7539_008056 [Penicillium diatomitis]KAJ5474990.1 hypothetical protein N7539_008056 [Penicillium diatomitis]
MAPSASWTVLSSPRFWPLVAAFLLVSLVASRPTRQLRDSSSAVCSPLTTNPLALPCLEVDENNGRLVLSGHIETSTLAIAHHSDLAPPSTSSAWEVAARSIQQMGRKAKATIAALTTIARTVNPDAWIWYEEDKEEASWLASSKSWFDRKACRWLGVCGASHFYVAQGFYGSHDPSRWSNTTDDQVEQKPWLNFWTGGADKNDQAAWNADERARREIPEYVFEYAPLVHLYSGEQFWPGDIAEHIYHTTPTLNYTPIQAQWDHPTLEDLDQLNQWQGGRNVFLTSDDDPTSRPPWLEGEKNIPEEPQDGQDGGDDDNENYQHIPVSKEKIWDGYDHPFEEAVADHSDDAEWDDLRRWTPAGRARLEQEQLARESRQAHRQFKQELRKRYGGHAPTQDHLGEDSFQSPGGRSEAPAILLVMDKGNGVVDAFWFYFYSFNLGNTVVNVRFGNHVGDWEHCLVRFHNGQPKALFFSAHTAGEAFRYEAVEKIGKRPVIYSASGSHAMYAHPGIHEYVLPWGLLHDVTDQGPLWDPVLNSKSYTYDVDNDKLRSSTANPEAPTEWFYFRGRWGDKFYPLDDPRQYRFAGQYHWVNGPTGPRFKHLDRNKVCQGPDRATCVIRDFADEPKKTPKWKRTGDGD